MQGFLKTKKETKKTKQNKTKTTATTTKDIQILLGTQYELCK